MASPSILRSATSSFHGQYPLVSAPLSARVPHGSHRVRVVSVKAATGAVLVEKSEAEKVNRLKATYLEKIIPKLKEEFSYQNIHEVTIFFSCTYWINTSMNYLIIWIWLMRGLWGLSLELKKSFFLALWYISFILWLLDVYMLVEWGIFVLREMVWGGLCLVTEKMNRH